MNGDCKIKVLLSSRVTFMLGVELVRQQHPVLEGTIVSRVGTTYTGTIRFCRMVAILDGMGSLHSFFYGEISHIEFKDE